MRQKDGAALISLRIHRAHATVCAVFNATFGRNAAHEGGGFALEPVFGDEIVQHSGLHCGEVYHRVAHLSANAHEFANVGAMIQGAVEHNVLNALFFVNVFHLVHHDAHGVAKHVVHVGFQLDALHVLHARHVFAAGLGPHFRVNGMRIRSVVRDNVQRRRGFDGGNHWFRNVRPNFHELVGLG